MKVSKDFDIREFVPKKVWDVFKEKSIWFVRPELIKLAQSYRDYFDRPVHINNWLDGGSMHERGFRMPDTTTGGKLSQHKFGCAFDCNIEGITIKQVYDHILDNQEIFIPMGLTTLENIDFTAGWLHSDIRFTGKNNLLIVNP